MDSTLRFIHTLIVFLLASLWVVIAAAAIEYFSLDDRIAPGLVIHGGILVVCVVSILNIITPKTLRALFETTGLTKTNWRYFLIAFSVASIVWVLDYWIHSQFFADEGRRDALELQLAMKQYGAISMVISTCLLAPVAEEILFRGIILNGLIEKISPAWAVLCSSLLFALIHFSINDFLTLTIVAIAYAILTLRSRSLWPAILAHTINNSVTFYYFATL